MPRIINLQERRGLLARWCLDNARADGHAGERSGQGQGSLGTDIQGGRAGVGVLTQPEKRGTTGPDDQSRDDHGLAGFEIQHRIARKLFDISDDSIQPRAERDRVLAGPAEDPIIPIPGDKQIVTRARDQKIRSGERADYVTAVTALDLVTRVRASEISHDSIVSSGYESPDYTKFPSNLWLNHPGGKIFPPRGREWA